MVLRNVVKGPASFKKQDVWHRLSVLKELMWA